LELKLGKASRKSQGGLGHAPAKKKRKATEEAKRIYTFQRTKGSGGYRGKKNHKSVDHPGRSEGEMSATEILESSEPKEEINNWPPVERESERVGLYEGVVEIISEFHGE